MIKNLPPEQNRDTPAGRALFLLYGGQQVAQEAGLKFSTRNLRRFKRSLSSSAGLAPPPAPCPPPKPKVAVPHFRGGGGGNASATAAAQASQQQLPRRRPVAQILSELRAVADEALHSPAPPPARPLLAAAEKERLALLMQHRGKVPVVMAAAGVDDGDLKSSSRRAAASTGGGSEVQRLQARFDVVQQEVEERVAWLEEMTRDGLLVQQSRDVLKGEIAQRVAEMTQLDAMLRAACSEVSR